ncbi:uncharacterized protein LOC134264080 [Saccostrea cucullata]|uniref:uncharacterized protein LOC134264080 n=1 Tax=Saccostrea cuccullata TaxID=36930 RepID=UPI002ED03CCC
MSDLTVDDWLNLAPCPPPWNPGLLYWTPHPINLTEGEIQRIAERCDVPPKDRLIMSTSVPNTPSVLIPVLVSVSVVLLGILIAVLIYSYKHKKHKTGDSCVQGSKCDLLEEMQGRGHHGCDNETYTELKTEQLPHSDKTVSQQGHQNLPHSDKTVSQQGHQNLPHSDKAVSQQGHKNLPHSYNTNTHEGLQISKCQTSNGKVMIENRAFP